MICRVRTRLAVRRGLSLLSGLVLVIAASAVTQARDIEMGGDSNYPYSIMVPESGIGAIAAYQITRRGETARRAAAAYELLRGARLIRRCAADAVAEDAAHSAGRRQRADHSHRTAGAGADRAARHEPNPQSAARHRDVPGPRLALCPAAGPLRRAGDRDRHLHAHLRDVRPGRKSVVAGAATTTRNKRE